MSQFRYEDRRLVEILTPNGDSFQRDTKLAKGAYAQAYKYTCGNKAFVVINPTIEIYQIVKAQRERFRQEIKTELKNKIKFFEAYYGQGSVCVNSLNVRGFYSYDMILPYLPGQDYADLLISYNQTLVFLIASARALKRTHEEGLVYRDFKDNNLRISSDGKAHMLDGGHCTKINETFTDTIFTRTPEKIEEARRKTQIYAPECYSVKGEDLPIARQSMDVFSLGLQMKIFLQSSHITDDVLNDLVFRCLDVEANNRPSLDEILETAEWILWSQIEHGIEELSNLNLTELFQEATDKSLDYNKFIQQYVKFRNQITNALEDYQIYIDTLEQADSLYDVKLINAAMSFRQTCLYEISSFEAFYSDSNNKINECKSLEKIKSAVSDFKVICSVLTEEHTPLLMPGDFLNEAYSNDIDKVEQVLHTIAKLIDDIETLAAMPTRISRVTTNRAISEQDALFRNGLITFASSLDAAVNSYRVNPDRVLKFQKACLEAYANLQAHVARICENTTPQHELLIGIQAILPEFAQNCREMTIRLNDEREFIEVEDIPLLIEESDTVDASDSVTDSDIISLANIEAVAVLEELRGGYIPREDTKSRESFFSAKRNILESYVSENTEQVEHVVENISAEMVNVEQSNPNSLNDEDIIWHQGPTALKR